MRLVLPPQHSLPAGRHTHSPPQAKETIGELHGVRQEQTGLSPSAESQAPANLAPGKGSGGELGWALTPYWWAEVPLWVTHQLLAQLWARG